MLCLILKILAYWTLASLVGTYLVLRLLFPPARKS